MRRAGRELPTAVLVLLAAQATPAAASADESYRAQTVALDAAAVGSTSAGIATLDWPTGRWFLSAGLALYGFGTPIYHLVRGNEGSAVASLALRVTMPLVGGSALGKKDMGGAIFGLMLGVAAAIVVDHALLDHSAENRPEQAPMMLVAVW